jgi:integrase
MSIEKHPKSPYYHYRFQIGGRRFKGSTRCTSRKAAQRREKEIRAEIEIEHSQGKLTVGNSIDEIFARYWRAHGHKLSWGMAVKDHLLEAAELLGGDRSINEIATSDISAVLEAYEAEGRAPATVNRRKDVLRGVWNKARDEWGIPVKTINWKILRRKEPKERVRYLQPDEVARLLKELPAHIRDIAKFSLVTGCRLNEVETLTWERVNLQTSKAEVLTKGGGTRFLHMNSDMRELLSSAREKRPDAEYVFDLTNRRKHWEAARLKAQLSDFRWHDMRHHALTMLGVGGASIQTIQKAAGHAQVATTSRYTHVLERDVELAYERIPRLVAEKE